MSANQKTYKKRPEVVVALSSLDTVILCQITNHRLPRVPTVTLTPAVFYFGRLSVLSYIRPDKLVTVDAELAQDHIGKLSRPTVTKTHQDICAIFKL